MPILEWSHAGWCVPDTWMEAEMHAMWVSEQRPTDLHLWMTYLCISSHLPSMLLIGRLWQPSGLRGRSPRPCVMGSGLRSAQLSWRLCQSVWVPLLDRGHSGSLSLNKWPIFPSPVHWPYLCYANSYSSFLFLQPTFLHLKSFSTLLCTLSPLHHHTKYNIAIQSQHTFNNNNDNNKNIMVFIIFNSSRISIMGGKKNPNETGISNWLFFFLYI